MLRVAHCVACTGAEGPGLRCAVWVQGCTLACPGCCNPELFAAAGGAVVGVAELAAEVLAVALLLLWLLSFLQPVVREFARLRGMLLYAARPTWQPHLPDILPPLMPGKRSLQLATLAFWSETSRDRHHLLDALRAAFDAAFAASAPVASPENRNRWSLAAKYTLPPNTGRSALPASPVKAGVAPALTRKSKVAATFETPVKWTG